MDIDDLTERPGIAGAEPVGGGAQMLESMQVDVGMMHSLILTIEGIIDRPREVDPKNWTAR